MEEIFDWWESLIDEQVEIEDIVKRFDRFEVGAFHDAVERRDKPEVLRIMTNAWENAPDQPWIRDIDGWLTMCELLANSED